MDTTGTTNRGPRDVNQAASTVVLAECHPDGTFLYGQKSLAEALDYSLEAMPNRVVDFLGKPDESLFQGLWDRVKTGESVFLSEYASLTANRKVCSFGLNIFPVFSEDGSVIAMRVILAKLDAQKELSYALASSEERFSAIFLESSDLILIISPTFEIVSANPAFENRLGIITMDFFRGERNWDDVIAEEHRESFEHLLNACTSSQQEQSGEYIVLCAERRTWFNITLSILHD